MVEANIGVGRHYDFIISALFMLSCWRIREEKRREVCTDSET
jgi:hypothetical protein